MTLPRGQFIGVRVGEDAADEAHHFFRCAECGCWVDMRDLGTVLDHEGPLPHPAEDRAQ
jgi:hypothetical protein